MPCSALSCSSVRVSYSLARRRSHQLRLTCRPCLSSWACSTGQMAPDEYWYHCSSGRTHSVLISRSHLNWHLTKVVAARFQTMDQQRSHLHVLYGSLCRFGLPCFVTTIGHLCSGWACYRRCRRLGKDCRFLSKSQIHLGHRWKIYDRCRSLAAARDLVMHSWLEAANNCCHHSWMPVDSQHCCGRERSDSLRSAE